MATNGSKRQVVNMTAATIRDLDGMKSPLGHTLGLGRKSASSRFSGGRMRDESVSQDTPRDHRATVKTILLVDDNREVAKGLADALTDEGYNVAIAGDGLRALDTLRWGLRPWCLLLDMRMPVMTGRELRQAMNADPQLRDIPVIGMTGGRWKAEDTLGFDALLEKPIDIEQLLDLLKNVANLKIRRGRGGLGVPESTNQARRSST